MNNLLKTNSTLLYGKSNVFITEHVQCVLYLLFLVFGWF